MSGTSYQLTLEEGTMSHHLTARRRKWRLVGIEIPRSCATLRYRPE